MTTRPRHDILFPSTLYTNKICPHVKKHCLATTHRHMKINSLNLSYNMNILYNMSTKVSLKDNHWAWMSHLTQLSSGRGHHKSRNMHTV